MLRLILMFATAATLVADDAAKDLEKFQGDWVMVSYTVDGKPAAADVLQSLKLNVKGDTSTFTIGKVTSMGTYKLDPAKKPKWLDILVTTGAEKGMTMLSIYEFDGEQLKICHSAANVKDRPKEFVSKPGTGHILEVWKKAK